MRTLPAFWSALRSARSFLFVPADRPDRVIKALASRADVIVVDLEDAVAPGQKHGARDGLVSIIEGMVASDRQRAMVRINAAETPWHEGDLNAVSLLVSLGLAGVMLPKAESALQIAGMVECVGVECGVVPLIESARGLRNVESIALTAQVVRLAFGHLDFQADLGMRCSEQEIELMPARLEIVLASRLADLPSPVDGVTADYRDTVRLEADSVRARCIGFGAKLAIHPSQIDHVHRAFAPTHAEVEWARRVLESSTQSRGGVVRLDGKMVDAPVVELAERVLAAAAVADAANR